MNAKPVPQQSSYAITLNGKETRIYRYGNRCVFLEGRRYMSCPHIKVIDLPCTGAICRSFKKALHVDINRRKDVYFFYACDECLQTKEGDIIEMELPE